MGREATAPPPAAPPAPPSEGGAERERIPLEVRAAGAAMALLPGLLVLYLSFNGGGFFPGTTAFCCLVLIQALILRVLLADRPFEGFNRWVAVVGLALTAFAGWVLLSGAWADANDRPLLEFDRALLYVVVFVLFGISARTQRRIPWTTRGLAIAIVAVSGAGLITRALPHVWPTNPGAFTDRLSFPLTYWNALGILSAVGILLLLGLSSSRTEPPWARVLACAAVPVLATTIYFTFSRGAVLALAAGLVAYLVTAGPRASWGTLIAVIPPTAVAAVVAFHADHLSSTRPEAPAAVTEGKHVALAVALAALGAAALRIPTLGLDGAIARLRVPASVHRARWAIYGGLALVFVLIAVAAGAPGWISDQYDGFVHTPPFNGADLRQRLTQASGSGRLDEWRVATHAFSAAPLHGHGAGTYEFLWAQHRPTLLTVQDAHSLYVEVLGELGVVGLALLLVVVVGIAVALARRANGPNRVLYAALFGAFVAWALHAGLDWDWEMPAVTAWAFAVGGTALASRRTIGGAGQVTANSGRVPLAIALAVALVTPALILFSQSRLDSAAKAFGKGNCTKATRDARSSIDMLAVRAEPYHLLGYCDMLDGRPSAAVAAMRKAIEQQPDKWEFHYGLALALSLRGSNPRREAHHALRLNPREELARSAAKAFDRAPRSRWIVTSKILRDDALSSGRLTFK